MSISLNRKVLIDLGSPQILDSLIRPTITILLFVAKQILLAEPHDKIHVLRFNKQIVDYPKEQSMYGHQHKAQRLHHFPHGQPHPLLKEALCYRAMKE